MFCHGGGRVEKEEGPQECNQRRWQILLCRMAEIGVRVLWTNFCYEFGGEYFLQMSGGPIGARVTMAARRLVMQEGYRGILDRQMPSRVMWMMAAK